MANESGGKMANEENFDFSLRQGFGKEEFDDLLIKASDLGVSDISIQSNGPVIFHRFGALVPATRRALQHFEVAQLVGTLYKSDNAIAILASGRDLDPRYEFQVSRGARLGFRVNLTQCRCKNTPDGYAITMRALPQNPPLLDELGRPALIADAMFPEQGLVIVVGATGSGKTTLLAGAQREKLEFGRNEKILTYECPIEFTYDKVDVHYSNLILQHEIGSHLMTFADGVRNALRRAPTAILVGESRDRETISATIEATLTGHATYTTVHAETVGGAMSRMVQSFDYAAHSSITEKLISASRLIVVQRLVRRSDGSGRVAINEWMTLGKEEKRILAGVMPDKIAAHIDGLIYEQGTSMAHHAAFEVSRGSIAIEAAAAAAGVSVSEIESLIGKLNPVIYETRQSRAVRLGETK